MVAEIFPTLAVVAEGAEIAPLRFEDSTGAMRFRPLSNITAYETALLLQLFLRMSFDPAQGGAMAWRAYLQRHMLLQHFEPLMKGQA